MPVVVCGRCDCFGWSGGRVFDIVKNTIHACECSL
uniref:Integrin beta-2:CYSTEINE-RICH MODULE 3, beta-2 subunit, cell adhesion n=1 Tax=Siphoviridae sp. ct3CA7 TaxID=2823561 RepID=A0A8S5LF48_9CAUD|nr:MAG TPA: Integrin beta-2:CYSTEINE-RICH MODULE 3, beta-2 subunit, cell adhesion [Siphoviridae sp. ct3CA7]